MANTPSFKQLQIDKATSRMVMAVSIATFLLIFTLISAKSLVALLNHQDRVISAQSTAVNQLTADITASHQLISSYNTFNGNTTNLLGSPSTGTTQTSGTNSKIVLDALPSEYDEAALAASLQYLLSTEGVTINSISNTGSSSGSDDGGSEPVPIPVTFSVSGPYQNVQNVMTTLEKSILPFQVQQISFSGAQNDVTLDITLQTYYQPATTFKITKGTIN